MTSWNQFGAAYDFPVFPGTPRSYLIASTPRCGSHYLGHLLRATGQLGSPLEYFSRGRIREWQTRLGISSLPELFRHVLRIRTAPTGWFGVKAHWPQVEPIAADAELFELFRFERFIQLTRPDRIAQAVSLVIAQQTSSWISFQAARRQPVYDAQAIAAALAGIEFQLGRWQQFFATRGIEPLVLVYDELVVDPAGTVDRVLAHCGLPAAAVAAGCDPLIPQRQASPLNAAWAERFRAEQATAAA